jgi:hypothetical protein
MEEISILPQKFTCPSFNWRGDKKNITSVMESFVGKLEEN